MTIQITFPHQAGVKGQGQEAGGVGKGHNRTASQFLNDVLLLIQKHAEDGLNGLKPSVTTQQHSRFRTGRW